MIGSPAFIYNTTTNDWKSNLKKGNILFNICQLKGLNSFYLYENQLANLAANMAYRTFNIHRQIIRILLLLTVLI